MGNSKDAEGGDQYSKHYSPKLAALGSIRENHTGYGGQWWARRGAPPVGKQHFFWKV